jgi:hypothetical protein
VYDIDSESLVRRRQWNRWFNYPSNNTNLNLETSSVSALAKNRVENVTMGSPDISVASSYKSKESHKSFNGSISTKHKKYGSNKSFQPNSFEQADCVSRNLYVEDKQRKVVPPLSFDKLSNINKRTETDAYNRENYTFSLMHLVTHRYKGQQEDYSRCFDRQKIDDYATSYSKTFRVTEKTPYCSPIVYLYNKQLDKSTQNEKPVSTLNIGPKIKKNSKSHNYYTEFRCRKNNPYLPADSNASVDVSENLYQNPLYTSRLGVAVPSTTASAK